MVSPRKPRIYKYVCVLVFVCVCECINLGPTEGVSENLLSYRLLCSACQSHGVKRGANKIFGWGSPFLLTLPNINLLIFNF